MLPFIRPHSPLTRFCFHPAVYSPNFDLKSKIMKGPTIILLLNMCLQTFAQQGISGKIRNSQGEGVAYANVFLEGSYDGCISDSSGSFFLASTLRGRHILRVSFMGYRTFTIPLFLEGVDTVLNITLQEDTRNLDAVTISAGTFTASDQKKSATLSSFDIATTASAMGDIYGAFATMPGSQKVGENGMLFVRGGEARETRTCMDGLYVQSPYYSKQPDIPTRGRYSPLLFSETVFSTGGYSAEYGQALSSVVDLNTTGLESSNKTSLALMTVGATASLARNWDKTSLALSGLYTNSALHHRMFRQDVDWTSHPVMGDASLMFRQKMGEQGLLKSFLSYNYSGMAMNHENFREGRMDPLEMRNHNLLVNTSYAGPLSEKWNIRGGLGWARDLEAMVYRKDPIHTLKKAGQGKVLAQWKQSELFGLSFGSSLIRESYENVMYLDSTLRLGLQNTHLALFTEGDLLVGKALALRGGLRTEYLSQQAQWTFSPRLSAALKTGAFSQISVAWGRFSQLPRFEYLVLAPELGEERAAHYILNFQYRRNQRQFRAEAYYKVYDRLLKFRDPYLPNPGNFSNKGRGYARGLDLFWRDRRSVKGLDYWVSYSYLDAKRDYRDYPSRATPDYASAHNLSVVTKFFFQAISTFAGLTYSFASPRPYHDPNSSAFMDGRTPSYHDLSLGLTYLCSLGGHEAVVHMNMTNVLGSRHVFGYTYANAPGEDGRYPSQALRSSTGRQAVMMILISF